MALRNVFKRLAQTSPGFLKAVEKSLNKMEDTVHAENEVIRKGNDLSAKQEVKWTPNTWRLDEGKTPLPETDQEKIERQWGKWRSF